MKSSSQMTEPPSSNKWKWSIQQLKWFKSKAIFSSYFSLKLVEISKAQDIEVGDGTTSVVVIAGSLLESCELLLDRGIHPTTISEGFQLALGKSLDILKTITKPVELSDRESLKNCVNTALASKVVSSNSQTFSPLAVEAVMKVFYLVAFYL